MCSPGRSPSSWMFRIQPMKSLVRADGLLEHLLEVRQQLLPVGHGGHRQCSEPADDRPALADGLIHQADALAGRHRAGAHPLGSRDHGRARGHALPDLGRHPRQLGLLRAGAWRTAQWRTALRRTALRHRLLHGKAAAAGGSLAAMVPSSTMAVPAPMPAITATATAAMSQPRRRPEGADRRGGGGVNRRGEDGTDCCGRGQARTRNATAGRDTDSHGAERRRPPRLGRRGLRSGGRPGSERRTATAGQARNATAEAWTAVAEARAAAAESRTAAAGKARTPPAPRRAASRGPALVTGSPRSATARPSRRSRRRRRTGPTPPAEAAHTTGTSEPRSLPNPPAPTASPRRPDGTAAHVTGHPCPASVPAPGDHSPQSRTHLLEQDLDGVLDSQQRIRNRRRVSAPPSAPAAGRPGHVCPLRVACLPRRRCGRLGHRGGVIDSGWRRTQLFHQVGGSGRTCNGPGPRLWGPADAEGLHAVAAVAGARAAWAEAPHKPQDLRPGGLS